MSSPIARHPDGSDCYTRNCSRGTHLPLVSSSDALKKQDVGAFLDARTADAEMEGTAYPNSYDPDIDTSDNFASSFATQLGDRARRLKDEIEKNGGKMEFPGLFDLNGNLVHAFLVNGKFGPVWKVVDKEGMVKEWVSASNAKDPKRRAANYAKKGYRLGVVKSPAYVRIEGSGTGTGGMLTTSPNVRQYHCELDQIEVVDNGEQV